MELHREYETVRSNLMMREPTPSLDTCLNELLREEQRCMTQMTMEQKGAGPSSLDVAYAT